MATLHVTMGVPASGKSTWASQSHFQSNPIVIVSPDSIRQELSGDTSNQDVSGEAFRLAHLRTAEALSDGVDVIFDATSTTQRARLDLLGHEADLHILHVFDVSLSKALTRNSNRERVVPEEVISRMWSQFADSLPQITREGWDAIYFHRSND